MIDQRHRSRGEQSIIFKIFLIHVLIRVDGTLQIYGLTVESGRNLPLEIHKIRATGGHHHIGPILRCDHYLIGLIVVVGHKPGGIAHIGRNVIIAVVEHVEGGDDIHPLTVVPCYGYGIHRYLIVKVPYQDRRGNGIIPSPCLITVIRPVDTGFNGHITRRATHVERKGDIRYTVDRKIHVLRKHQSAVVVELDRNILICVHCIPVVNPYLDRDLIVLVGIVFREGKIGNREIVVGQLPYSIKRDICVVRIVVSRCVGNAR